MNPMDFKYNVSTYVSLGQCKYYGLKQCCSRLTHLPLSGQRCQDLQGFDILCFPRVSTLAFHYFIIENIIKFIE